MVERFTDKARTAVIAARAEAAERGDQIRPVYLPHALATGDGVAARALASIGIDLDEIARRVEESFGPGALDRSPGPAQGTGRIAMTPGGEGQSGVGTLPCRYIDLTVKAGHTVLTESIYSNTQSHNLS